MNKALVKSSNKKQRLYEQFLKNRNLEKEANYKHYKTLFKSLKKKSKKNYYLDYSHKKRKDSLETPAERAVFVK